MLKHLKEALSGISLPIGEAVPSIRLALLNGRNAVVDAPPGAGKTTLVPLSLLEEPWLRGGRIVMLEPRRLAARAAASRMADLLGEETGQTVGYRTRLDSSIGPSTRIEVVTEGILTRFLQNDPSLEGIGLLIFDEFHERSIHADLGLALSLESQSVLREDLRILVMSATLDLAGTASFLGNAPVVRSTGRAHPVEVRYLAGPTRPARVEPAAGTEFISRAVSAVSRSIREETGSVLVFLPGSAEIRRVEAGLREKGLPASVDMIPLYGDLQKQAQDRAIRPSPAGRRKVVLATSIAETSITIEGVRVVIDCGLRRVPRFSPSTGMSRLETVRVTRDSAAQRCGRAGRLAPGICVRLWPENENSSLLERATPEILEADLAPLALELAVWGAADPKELRWLNPPPAGALSQARELLARLKAVDRAGKATGHGKGMAKLPLHPRLAHMVIKGRAMGLGSLACLLAAFLTERDFLKAGPAGMDPDIRHRLDLLTGNAPYGLKVIDRSAMERVKAAARQTEMLIGAGNPAEDTDKAGLLLAFAYPDRVAKRRASGRGRFLLANGRGAVLREQGLEGDYIVAASLDGGETESRIFLAAPVKEAELEEYFIDEISQVDLVEWDQAGRCVSSRRQRRLWDLVLSDCQIKAPDESKLLGAFLTGVRQNGLGVLPWDKASLCLRARIDFLTRTGHFPRAGSTGLSDERLLRTLDEWLGPWVRGMTRLDHLKKLDMKGILMGMLARDERASLERLAPAHITVPSGSRIAVDYASGERPVLAVRLQEMFGLGRTPAVAGGKVPLVLHLLSPAGRPVQVTDDLAGFWAAGYQTVRKELRGRYPKHSWPEDPMSSEPTRGARRKRQNG